MTSNIATYFIKKALKKNQIQNCGLTLKIVTLRLMLIKI